jgi:hypothetical protein
MDALTLPESAHAMLSQEFAATASSTLDVDVPRANVRLRAGQDDRIQIDVSATGASGEDAEAYLERMQLTTRQSRGTVRLTVDPDRQAADWWSWLRRQTVRLFIDVRLPPAATVKAHTTGGVLDAEGLTGSCGLEATGGALRTARLGGTLVIDAQGSAIAVTGFEGDALDLTVAGGDVHLQDLAARTAHLRVAGSRLSAERLDAETRLQASGTAVTLRQVQQALTLAVHGAACTIDGAEAALDLRVTGGPLTLRLPPSFDADLALEGEPVTLDSGLPFEGERAERLVEGRLGAGGTPVQARATRGALTCQPA